jgi:PAS domain S-box-containing protein
MDITAEKKSTGETWKRMQTVRSHTASKLRESEEKHRSLILQMQEGLVVDDENGNIQLVNPMFCKMTGFEEHELVGKSGYDLMLTRENTVKMFERDKNRRKNLSEDYELEITAKNGKAKTLWFHATPVLDGNGGFIGSMSTVIDITERKQLEIELNEQTQLRELLMEISSGFINIPFELVDQSIEEALKKMALFVGADRSYTFDYDWKNDCCNNTFEWCAQSITPEIENLQEVPLSMMQDWVEAHRKGEPMYVPDVFELPRGAVREILEPQGIKSVLAVPMMDEERCIGFVGFDSVRKHHNYSGTEQQLLKLFALSLTNVRKRKDMMQELIASKENAEEKEKHFSSIFHETHILFWEEDFSQVKTYFGELKQKGVSDFTGFFAVNPGEIMICAQKTRIIDVNDAVLQTLKYPDKKALVENFHKTLTPLSMIAFRDALINLAEEKQYFECVTEHRTRTGEIKQFFLKSFVSTSKRDYSRVIVAMTDISDLIAKEKELISSKEKAEENDRLKTAFLQNLSHEIRTPLNGIIGFSELLRDSTISEEDRNYFTGIVIERGWQLTAIIDDILTMSSIETKQEQLYNEPFNLNTLLKNHLDTFAGQATAKGLQLLLKTSLSELEAEILADKSKLVQILNNLFTNAIKFTSTGGIELGCRLSGDYLEFQVKDTGPGIDKAKHQLIFERFTQADESIRRIYGGTGLGLSICRGFAELMGGTIWVESEPGHGSLFAFTLPYHPAV